MELFEEENGKTNALSLFPRGSAKRESVSFDIRFFSVTIGDGGNPSP